jgi:predicted dinucleotide-binding enzyme
VTVTEAAHGGEIVIIAIPKHAVVDLPTDLFIGVPNDVVVIENGRPAGAAGRIALPVAGDPPDARRSQNALPAAWLVAVGRKNRYRNASRLLSPVIESVDAAYSAACGS